MAGSKIRLAAMGDILMNRKDPESMFARHKDYFDQFDIVFANLEAPLPSKEFPKRGLAGGRGQRGEAWMVKGLAGVLDVVSVANNHIMDFGWAGLEDTIKTLNENNIATTGAGINQEKAAEPAILERKGVKVGFLAFNAMGMFVGAATDHLPGIAQIRVNALYDFPHMNPWDVELVMDRIQSLRPKVDFVVLSFHWGAIGNAIASYQRVLGKEAIDAGADLIIGTHPHAIQGLEIYKGRIILHSLGNFAVDHSLVHELHELGNETMVFECSIVDGKIEDPAVRVGVVHLHDGKDAPELLTLDDETGKAVAGKLEKFCRPLGTAFTRAADKMYINIV